MFWTMWFPVPLYCWLTLWSCHLHSYCFLLLTAVAVHQICLLTITAPVAYHITFPPYPWLIILLTVANTCCDINLVLLLLALVTVTFCCPLLFAFISFSCWQCWSLVPLLALFMLVIASCSSSAYHLMNSFLFSAASGPLSPILLLRFFVHSCMFWKSERE